MSKRKEEPKGAGVLPALPAVLKPAAAGGGLSSFLAGKAGVAALSGLLGLATVGGYQVLTGGGQGAGRPAKNRYAPAKRLEASAVKAGKAGSQESASLSMAREANPEAYAGAASPGARAEASGGEVSGEGAQDGAHSPAAEAVDASALEAEEASKAEILSAARKVSAPKPRLDANNLSGFSAGGGGGSGGAAGGGAGEKPLLAAARGPADGSTLSPGGAKAGAPSALRRFGGAASGKLPRTGGAAHQSSLSKLSGMNRQFKGASGGSDPKTSYETQKLEWDGGRALSGAGGEPSGEPGKRGVMSSSHGDNYGRPLGGSSSSDEDYYGSSRNGKLSATNVTPYQQMVDMAQALLMLASALLTLSFIFGLMGRFIPAMSAAFYAVAKYMAYAAAAVAAVVTLLGLGIMMTGQAAQGAVFTGVGALLTVLSYVSAEGYGEAADSAKAAKGEALKKGAEATNKLAKPALWTSGIGAGAGFGAASATHNNNDGWADDQKEKYGG